MNGIIASGQGSPFGSNIQTTPNKNFEPRVGFSYDVVGNGKTALRGGFGLDYFSITGNQYKFAQGQNYPSILNTTISNPSSANPGNGVPQFSASPNILQALQVHDPAPYSEQIRPYLGYSAITTQSKIFSSNYNSLQVSAKKQFTTGGIVTVSYTWANAMTNARTPQNSSNLTAEYSHTDLNRASVFNASFVYPLPFFKAQQGIVGHIVGGFEVNGIVSYGSGTYSTSTATAVDPGGVGLLVGPAAGRPDYLANPNKSAPRTFKSWFNTAAFGYVPAGQYRWGNARPDSMLGPGYENWDLSLYGTARIEKSPSVQFRLETYNATTLTSPASPPNLAHPTMARSQAPEPLVYSNSARSSSSNRLTSLVTARSRRALGGEKGIHHADMVWLRSEAKR